LGALGVSTAKISLGGDAKIKGSNAKQGLKMATWKRLTDTNQRKIDVNVDSVAYFQPFEKHTSIHFIGGEPRINVKETPDQIHLADPLRHK